MISGTASPALSVELIKTSNTQGTLTAGTYSQAQGNNPITYDLNRAYRIDVVFNATGAPLTDYSGSEDLADGHADVWLTDLATGTSTLVNQTDIKGRDGNIPPTSILMGSGGDFEFAFDNHSVVEGVSIGRPASLP